MTLAKVERKEHFTALADSRIPRRKTNVQKIYVAETRNRVKMSDDLDCLPADAIRIETRIFASDADIFRAGLSYQKRGFDVCIDTTTIDCYEFGQNELAQTQAHALISRKPFTLE